MKKISILFFVICCLCGMSIQAFKTYSDNSSISRLTEANIEALVSSESDAGGALYTLERRIGTCTIIINGKSIAGTDYDCITINTPSACLPGCRANK